MRPANEVSLEEIESEINTWRKSQLEELLGIVQTLISAREADEVSDWGVSIMELKAGYKQVKKPDERGVAIAELRKLFRKGGYKAYTVLRHCSRSGMYRRISVFVMLKDGPYEVDHLIAKLGTYKRASMDEGEGLQVGGCGMDMGFAVVYDTSAAIFRDGEDAAKIHKKLGQEHFGSSAGYVLRQHWM